MSSLTLACLSFLFTAVTTETDRSLEAERKVPISAETPTSVSVGWAESFESARQAAAERQVPILMHFGARWCGACRRMESQVLNRQEVLSRLGAGLIAVRIDADQHRDLISQYRVTTLPTDVVVLPDGTETARFVGAVSLNTYISRLEKLAASEQNDTRIADASGGGTENGTEDSSEEKTRSCLIVRRDGKMVGLGGFSPVALSEQHEWHKGQEEFVVEHQGVEYFLCSEDEVTRFQADPERYVPHLHGCDPVELHLSRQARAGAIEFGSFYRGEVFFFASLENRQRFLKNPAWYLKSDEQPDSESEAVELLDMIR